MNNSYIIAEIGNNHNGKIKKAKLLIDACANAKVNAVKFQTFRGIDIVSPKVKANEYKGWDVKGLEFWHQFLDTIALPLDQHQEIINYTLSKKLDFITTPTSPYIVDFLEKLKGIKAYKIASMDLTNVSLLKAVAKTKKKIIMSTGMGDINEIKNAVKYFKNHDLSILHCVSDYPLDPDKAFLNNIKILKETFPKYKIGFSDHSLGHELCIAARCLNATIFEKHITLDRNDKEPAEHHFSMEPNEFKELVNWIKSIDVNLKNSTFSRSKTEIVNKLKYRRSYHFNNNFKKGKIINWNDLTFVRPGDGIDNNEINKIIGKTLNKNVKAFEPCKLNLFN